MLHRSKAATLFDTGANASYVNREVAVWIEVQAGMGKQQVLDSCIAIIVGRPIIRENHLVRKIPQYYDEMPSSKPDLNQPVEPVITPVTSRAACRGTQSCNTCTPFVAQGYSDTLCSLSVLRTDHPHVPQERRRPHVEPFATHPLTDGTNLIPRNALLDAMDDDDDIE